ncbi:hypothetical protein V8B55DRAFT_1408985 [Mucor lusitanicus]|uniref:Uncharacterized protein n=2 Tax=Mucor circinelloides f. lusitanicus TaxID=29924 RepID=A0A168J7G6_MUCCL|nr:hypothetical protein FB192DRAFT_1347865 [Mucor lusitanicus]OAD00844.1 hypothetical protein MUCCIDRAFT_164768 [Mucor lusitanicus CBS 277.49]
MTIQQYGSRGYAPYVNVVSSPLSAVADDTTVSALPSTFTCQGQLTTLETNDSIATPERATAIDFWDQAVQEAESWNENTTLEESSRQGATKPIFNHCPPEYHPWDKSAVTLANGPDSNLAWLQQLLDMSSNNDIHNPAIHSAATRACLQNVGTLISPDDPWFANQAELPPATFAEHMNYVDAIMNDTEFGPYCITSMLYLTT